VKRKKRDPELDELLERGRRARRQMQEIIDRVDARMEERGAHRERSLFRRLFPR
jgi:DNA-binding MarR family transcriptional regulator